MLQTDPSTAGIPNSAAPSLFSDFVALLIARDELANHPEATWIQVSPLEQKIWDAAGELLGNQAQLQQTLLEALEHGDQAEQRAAVWLMSLLEQGQQSLSELLAAWVSKDTNATVSLAQAIVKGLESVAAESCMPLIYQMARHGQPIFRAQAAWYMGYRRQNMPTLLLALLDDDEENVVAEAGLAAGKLGIIELRPRLEHLMRQAYQQQVWPLRDKLALALHLLGSPLPSFHARACLQGQEAITPILALLMALDGRLDDEVFFHQLIEDDPEEPVYWEALSYWGYPQAVPILIDALAEEQEVEVVADALIRITGHPFAEIRTEDLTPVADHTDEDAEDELIDDDALESLDEDTEDFELNPKIQDPFAWHQWWLDNKSRFDDQTRYRGGQPLHGKILLDTLTDENSGINERRRALWELARCKGFGPGMAFEPDWWTQHQYHYLSVLKDRLNQD